MLPTLARGGRVVSASSPSHGAKVAPWAHHGDQAWFGHGAQWRRSPNTGPRLTRRRLGLTAEARPMTHDGRGLVAKALPTTHDGHGLAAKARRDEDVHTLVDAPGPSGGPNDVTQSATYSPAATAAHPHAEEAGVTHGRHPVLLPVIRIFGSMWVLGGGRVDYVMANIVGPVSSRGRPAGSRTSDLSPVPLDALPSVSRMRRASAA